MGMDVYGNNGNYFHASVWRWRPLATLCTDLAPDICAKCKNMHTNDGYGLDNKNSIALAAVLQASLEDGTVDKYIEERDRQLRDMPDVPCNYCKGSGARSSEATGTAKCNVCGGSGKKRPFETWYTLDRLKVEQWVDFLNRCGGFRIY